MGCLLVDSWFSNPYLHPVELACIVLFTDSLSGRLLYSPCILYTYRPNNGTFATYLPTGLLARPNIHDITTAHHISLHHPFRHHHTWTYIDTEYLVQVSEAPRNYPPASLFTRHTTCPPSGLVRVGRRTKPKQRDQFFFIPFALLFDIILGNRRRRGKRRV